MFNENQLLELLRVQANITPQDFESLFGKDRGRILFNAYAQQNWNLVSFLFNNINGDERNILLNHINELTA